MISLTLPVHEYESQNCEALACIEYIRALREAGVPINNRWFLFRLERGSLTIKQNIDHTRTYTWADDAPSSEDLFA